MPQLVAVGNHYDLAEVPFADPHDLQQFFVSEQGRLAASGDDQSLGPFRNTSRANLVQMTQVDLALLLVVRDGGVREAEFAPGLTGIGDWQDGQRAGLHSIPGEQFVEAERVVFFVVLCVSVPL